MGGLMARRPAGSDEREVLKPGMYQAVCYRYYDLGTHHVDYTYQGKHIVGDNRKVHIAFEIPSERIEIDKDGITQDLPRVQSKEYNLTLGKKANLRNDLQSWRGRDFTEKELDGFSLDKILGVNATLNIIHNDKGYPIIASINPLTKGVHPVKPENEVYGWSFDNDGPDQLPKDIPDWIREKIESSMEWQGLNENPIGKFEPDNEPRQDPDFGPPNDIDDIPF